MLEAGLGESDDPTRRGRNFHCLLSFRIDVGVRPGIQINPVSEINDPAFRHHGTIAHKFGVERLVSVTADRTDDIELPDVPWRFGGGRVV